MTYHTEDELLVEINLDSLKYVKDLGDFTNNGIHMPKQKSMIEFGGFTIYLTKKMNILLRCFFALLGVKAENIKDEDNE